MVRDMSAISDTTWRTAVTTETPPISLTLEMLDFNAKGVSNCISLCREYRIHDM